MSTKPKLTKTKCPDCGATYVVGKPHTMFCPAHTCDECGSSFSFVIPKEGDGVRRCERCLEERMEE